MRALTAERRREQRVTVDGEVRLRQQGSIAAVFTGSLIDVSPGGFRVRHSRLTLASGQRVEFEWAGRSGRARVMWHRILGTEAETGFAVTE